MGCWGGVHATCELENRPRATPGARGGVGTLLFIPAAARRRVADCYTAAGYGGGAGYQVWCPLRENSCRLVVAFVKA